MKALINFFTEIAFYNGSLYLRTKDGNVLTGGIPKPRMILNGNQVSFQLLSSNGDQVGTVGNVYVLALPENSMVVVIQKNIKFPFVLLMLIFVDMAIIIFTSVPLNVRAAIREMKLCIVLIRQKESTQQVERKKVNKSLAFASASHDVRASLAGLIGLTEICNYQVVPG
ncbi:histidine kinase CKI1-like [Olea europaea subsp. europaea]|uniref:Histidine kinase CKI1-like n=1 Tax=Olea europaea subsp. europaea TaxID=158383 RepID=A0A8S0USB3_OLEEU|nr:histidine kinase CKI1-like [Olea europaea subsp. europaea]